MQTLTHINTNNLPTLIANRVASVDFKYTGKSFTKTENRGHSCFTPRFDQVILEDTPGTFSTNFIMSCALINSRINEYSQTMLKQSLINKSLLTQSNAPFKSKTPTYSLPPLTPTYSLPPAYSGAIISFLFNLVFDLTILYLSKQLAYSIPKVNPPVVFMVSLS